MASGSDHGRASHTFTYPFVDASFDLRPLSVALQVVKKKSRVDVIEPNGVEIPKPVMADIRKILRYFHRKYGIRKPFEIKFREGIEWGWENGREVIISTSLDRDQTLLMMVHELLHVVSKMDHDKEARKRGYRSYWRLYKDRDTYSENLACEILGRRVSW